MDNRHEDWYGRSEDRRRNEGRRVSDRGTEPPRHYRHGDVRTDYPRGGYPEHQVGPYRGGPLAASCAIHMNPNDPASGIKRNVVVRTVKAPCMALVAMT